MQQVWKTEASVRPHLMPANVQQRFSTTDGRETTESWALRSYYRLWVWSPFDTLASGSGAAFGWQTTKRPMPCCLSNEPSNADRAPLERTHAGNHEQIFQVLSEIILLHANKCQNPLYLRMPSWWWSSRQLFNLPRLELRAPSPGPSNPRVHAVGAWFTLPAVIQTSGASSDVLSLACGHELWLMSDGKSSWMSVSLGSGLEEKSRSASCGEEPVEVVPASGQHASWTFPAVWEDTPRRDAGEATSLSQPGSWRKWLEK